jgi:hypothetical protein
MDFHEGEKTDEKALKTLVRAARDPEQVQTKAISEKTRL